MPARFMSTAGLALLTFIGVFYLAFGALYASVGDYLFFHRAALPAGSDAAFRPLYLGLMKLIGGASLAVGALGLFLLYSSVRRRRPNALAALAAGWSAPLVFAAYVAETLRTQTGAPTSANLMIILLAILAAGVLSRAIAGKSSDAKALAPS